MELKEEENKKNPKSKIFYCAIARGPIILVESSICEGKKILYQIKKALKLKKNFFKKKREPSNH